MGNKYTITALNAHVMNKIQKHFHSVMLVGMASKISNKYTYKSEDFSGKNRIKGAMTILCAH